MTITLDQFTKIFGANKDAAEIVEELNEQLPKFDINTKDRICAFLAQAGHESGHFKVRSENLNYSLDGLRKVFPKYFPDEATAKRYARQPQAIANRVYGGRMGNGGEVSGDGYKFRGKGYIQLTGKQNQTAFAAAVGMTVDEAIAYLDTIEGAVASACWFWSTNGLNKLADAKDIKGMTKRINGGYIGLAERTSLYNKAQSVV